MIIREMHCVVGLRLTCRTVGREVLMVNIHPTSIPSPRHVKAPLPAPLGPKKFMSGLVATGFSVRTVDCCIVCFFSLSRASHLDVRWEY